MLDDLLEVNSNEQLRKFLADDTTFIDANFLDSVVYVIFSKLQGSDDKIKNAIRDNLIAFSLLCSKYNNMVVEHGIENSLDIVDKNVMTSVIDMSAAIISDSNSNIGSRVFDYFRELMSQPVSKLNLETNPDLMDKYKKYQIPNSIKLDDCESLQKILEQKIEVIDIISQIKNFSRFITNEANNCNSLTEFAKGFIETIDKISTNLTATTNTDEVLSLADVMSGEGFADIIETNDDKVKSGISILDAIMGGGFDRGRIYMFGGQTGGGKSTVLLNILYGMLKICNGVYFNENDIYNGSNINNSLNIIQTFINTKINNYKGPKKLFLYYTLENTKEETVKRLMCRMGLLPGTFWLLLERDKRLAKCFKEKGYNITTDDLPADMNPELKNRLVNYAKMLNIVYNKNQIGNIEIIWRAPYSITAYDIIMDCKKYQRRGFQIESIFIDYPDKMRATTSTKNRTDQEWLELGKIIDNLKALAAQINVPVLTVTQINREANKDAKASKLGATAGSIQKEYNADTQVNMNFNNDGDTGIEEYFKQFTEQQQRSNFEREKTFKDLLNNKINVEVLSSNKFINDITTTTARSSDVIRMKIGVPMIQTVECYVTKNRDSVAKVPFNLYIAYGMYLVTDFENEVYASSRYSVETYMLIANYMLKNGYISPETFRVAVESESAFIFKYNNFDGQKNGKMSSKADSVIHINTNPLNNLSQPGVINQIIHNKREEVRPVNNQIPIPTLPDTSQIQF